MAESDLIRGNVDTIILKVLYEGDRYGYDLIKQINSRSGGQWEIKQPTVYACLKRLEKQGFITSYWDSAESDGGRRKYYSLTDSGKEVFLQYKSEFERAHALFGGLISDAEQFKNANDFDDVEDETYSVPKRRSRRTHRPSRERRSEQPLPEKAEEPEEQQPQTEKTLEEPAEQTVEEPAAEQSFGEYIQGSLFPLTEEQADDGVRFLDEDDVIEPEEAPAPEPTPEPQAAEPAKVQDAPPARPAVDPRSIIDRYFASETGESFAEAHERTIYRPAPPASPAPQPVKPTVPAVADKPATEPAPKADVRPAPSPAPAAPERPSSAPPAPTPSPVRIFEDEDESPARREYKTVLSELVERFEVAAPDIRKNPSAVHSEEQAAAVASAEDERFYAIKQSAREFGSDVTVKSHNDSAKKYSQKFYYYSNKLLMTHYTIMCAAMFVVGLILFLSFYSGAGIRMQYDFLLYMGAGLLPIAMFIVAVIRYALDLDKRKRINVNFRFSIIVRFVFALQAMVIIYCLNVIWGMPVGFSATYVPSLVIPAAYSLFIPISEVIFMTLLKSGRYAVE